MTADLPVLAFASREEWRVWLDAEHADSRGLWIKFAKKGSGVASVTHDEALEVALAYGWIDGQVKKVDVVFFLQRWTPRTARSMWSRINREAAERLIAAGEMQPAGLAEVERARGDGRWAAAYEPQSTSVVPDDLQRELDASPRAAEFFAGLDGRNRYAILHRLATAKKPETRARRLEQFVALLNAGEKIYP